MSGMMGEISLATNSTGMDFILENIPRKHVLDEVMFE
jgi:hypothetical protein